MKNKDLALKVSGTLFTLVALTHLVRLLRRIPLSVNGTSLPLNASLIGFLVTGLLAFWMFYASRE